MKKKFKIDSKYSEKTQVYLEKIIDTLYKEQNEISAANEVTLELLAQNLELYFNILKNLDEEGLMIKGRDGMKVKNPLIAALNSENLFIAKLINNLGVTPTAKNKMKNLDDNDEDFEENLIS